MFFFLTRNEIAAAPAPPAAALAAAAAAAVFAAVGVQQSWGSRSCVAAAVDPWDPEIQDRDPGVPFVFPAVLQQYSSVYSSVESLRRQQLSNPGQNTKRNLEKSRQQQQFSRVQGSTRNHQNQNLHHFRWRVPLSEFRWRHHQVPSLTSHLDIHAYHCTAT